MPINQPFDPPRFDINAVEIRTGDIYQYTIVGAGPTAPLITLTNPAMEGGVFESFVGDFEIVGSILQANGRKAKRGNEMMEVTVAGVHLGVQSRIVWTNGRVTIIKIGPDWFEFAASDLEFVLPQHWTDALPGRPDDLRYEI